MRIFIIFLATISTPFVAGASPVTLLVVRNEIVHAEFVLPSGEVDAPIRPVRISGVVKKQIVAPVQTIQYDFLRCILPASG